MTRELEWTAHPARRRPRDLALVVSVLLLTMGAVVAAFQSIFFALLAAVILIAAISSFLFPTRYRIDAWGVRETRLGRVRARPWTELRRLEAGDRTALLSPFPAATWMDRYRALIVQFDGADRGAVLAELKERFDART